MKRTILLWILTAVLLCGCGAKDLPETTDTPASSTSVHAVPEGYYAPDHSLEQQTGGTVRVYPLDIPDSHGIAVIGTDILVFSGDGGSTQLTLLRGNERYPAILLSVDTEIYAHQASTQATAQGLSYYDAARRETVILDENLREIATVTAPENMTGSPLLTADRKTMYYCAGSNLCALDMDTGISQVLRQHSEELTLEAIQLDSTLVQCREAGGSILFFSAETGQLVDASEMDLLLETNGNRYIAALGQEDSPLVFGSAASPVQMLQTRPQAEYTPLPGSFAVLEAASDGLHFYDLSSGLRTSSLRLDSSLTAAADGGNGILWLLAEDGALYRWDTNSLPSGDSTIYTATYFTRSNPDLAGLAACQELARQIGERHGVEILVWEDALAVAPWDYRVTEEYQVPILEEQLHLLDQRLKHFPEGFFAQMPERLTICLVRSLEGYNGQETVEAASGVQYWVESRPYIALSTLTSTEGGLYHELCHVFDSRVIGQSNAYDQWEELNPGGFQYDYDYAANATRNAGEYLRDAERCFIDTYSMSFPKEDRARVLEYAMTPGNEHYFQSEVMQAKLKQVCLGIREAFGLKKSPETFLWEQYLAESLAYRK